MFDILSYVRVLLTISGGLLTLLGSVGIFISLIIQRRVERLQDILEEFLDLSYHEDINLTGRMYRLIEKYQMHYLLPSRPSRTILWYVNSTIILVIIAWISVLLINFKRPFQPITLIYLLPIISSLAVLLFYRELFKNAINPVENRLLSAIIPPPTLLRSVSFLSKYVNISVKSILKHARLRIIVKPDGEGRNVVILKEELSFDDYFYFLHLFREDKTFFIGFGELKMDFGCEPITGKPVPVARNVNIPLGHMAEIPAGDRIINARLFIFPRGEKHPIEYNFDLYREKDVIHIIKEPEISVNYMVTYRGCQDVVEIIENHVHLPYFQQLGPHFHLDRRRWYWDTREPFSRESVKTMKKQIYID